MNNPDRAVPNHILRDTINHGQRLPDTRGTTADMYYIRMWKNERMYNLEVLYDQLSNTVMHFKYTPRSIGPLPRVPK